MLGDKQGAFRSGDVAASNYRGERSSNGRAQRKGYRDRASGRQGRWSWAPGGFRKGSYFPSFLEPRRMAEKALTFGHPEAYVRGVSTRSVDVKAMGGIGSFLALAI
jgi:transposase-like protein